MSKKILIGLIISTKINEKDKQFEKNKKRKEHIIEGLKKFFEYKPLFDANNIDILLSDNTTKNIDKEILDVLPDDIIVVSDHFNKYGCKNKGAGVIEHWLFNKQLIEQYDWFIHFEPRTLLIDNSFFQRFLKYKINLFTYGSIKKNCFYTGLFVIDTKSLYKFCKKYDLNYLVKNKISIEYILFDFIKENSKFELVNKCNVVWHDTIANKDHVF